MQFEEEVGGYQERSAIWYDYFLLKAYEQDRWKHIMGMPKNIFYWIVGEVADKVRRQDTKFRKPVPVDIRIGACIHRLVTGHIYFHVGDRLGLGESTVQELMSEVMEAIIMVLGPRYLKWPKGEEQRRTSEGFKRRSGLPNCVGAVDGTHIRLRAPKNKEDAIDYNCKGYYSIVLQAVTDIDGCFLDISVRMPGSVNNKRCMRVSSLYHQAMAGEILSEPVISINGGFQLAPYLLGDGGYFMEKWLMVPLTALSLGTGFS